MDDFYDKAPACNGFVDKEDLEFEKDDFNLRDTSFFDINELTADRWQYQDPRKANKFNDFFFMDKMVISLVLFYQQEREERELPIDHLTPLRDGRIFDSL